jgi:hypothetical protein
VVKGAHAASAQDSGGLSVGAQAGIGIACAVIGIGLIVGALFVWRRKRQSKVSHTEAQILEKDGFDGAQPSPLHEVPASAYREGSIYRYEKDGARPIAQLDGSRSPVEMENPYIYLELPANSVIGGDTKKS